MNRLLSCRRTFIAFASLCALTAMACVKGIDTSTAIAAIAIGLAGANAGQAVGTTLTGGDKQ